MFPVAVKRAKKKKRKKAKKQYAKLWRKKEMAGVMDVIMPNQTSFLI